MMLKHVFHSFVCILIAASLLPAEPPSVSGIYPHLAMFNEAGECGTGAVVPWAERLWVITYAPHKPQGSSDKLYEITPDLKQIIRPESVGGTPANRMIHRESQQLFIGPYAIDAQRKVRVIPYSEMLGRPTGNARHLVDPANKIYYATMEEGFYEVDVKTLAVKELYPDNHAKKGVDLFPGYHGKGLYSAQGRLVYSNNGEHGSAALKNPRTPSGVLAEWDGKDWKIVRRNQFTEVTGPGGITGNAQANDPLWAVGWDHRSLLLMLLDAGQWHTFRLPKGSHSYDGAHGWNTEWPRIREIGETDLLMTMHGTFWRFPRTFSAKNTAGIRPRSNYLKVVGDFCRWQDRLVLGCDDAAKSEFLNVRKVKGKVEPPGKSQSNLWFVSPETLDQLGPALGYGAVWLKDAVAANQPSDPFLFSGYEQYALTIYNDEPQPLTVTLEIDRRGTGEWTAWKTVELPPRSAHREQGAISAEQTWLRASVNKITSDTTLFVHLWNQDRRSLQAHDMFAGVATAELKDGSGGIVRARGDERRKLSFAASVVRAGQIASEAYYEMDVDLKLQRVESKSDQQYLHKHAAIPSGVITLDEASVLVVDDAGRRFRLPKGTTALEQPHPLPMRVSREVCTERDLFNAAGTFYELPAENADGFMRVRPIATHNRRITDYCSWRGLLVLSGIDAFTPATNQPAMNQHVIRSDDGQAALWVGAVDDLWKFGKPHGQGGPWKHSVVKQDVPSDPYLLSGFDRKQLTLSHNAQTPVTFTLELDDYATGDWHPLQTHVVKPGETLSLSLDEVRSYWLRVRANADCQATAWLVYE